MSQNFQSSNERCFSGLTYFVPTFGCQMNEHDAERVAGMLESQGALPALSEDTADIIVFMTCCVREAADTRLYGRVASIKNLEPPQSGLRTIAVGGCIGQRDAEKLFEILPHVDVVFGTQTLHHLPRLIEEARKEPGHQISVEEFTSEFSTDLPSKREKNYSAWLPITAGCNNFCTYCIVPYVRGREKSRLRESIVEEAQHLVEDGVKEITLLGQNVNSYGRDIYGAPKFAELLYDVAATGIERLRFTTSHPKDLSDDTIKAMSELECVMPHLHLPVQAGSDRVLQRMNRTYNSSDYRRLIDKVRTAMPDIALSTDIIVGFPGETENDFLETLKLVEEVGYSQAFTFIYSKREGTPAAKWDDDTPRSVIQERFDRLTKVIQESAYQQNQKELDKVVPVLIEGSSKRDEFMLTGRSPKNQTVHAPINHPGATLKDFIGKIYNVHVVEAKTWYLKGSLIE